MNEENKIVKVLIPLIAVVIVVESVVLVSNLSKGGVVNNNGVSQNQEASQSTEIKKTELIADLVFATDSKEMKVGKSYKVELSITSKDNRTIDALDTFIKYDPSLVTVSGLTSGTQLPKPTVNKVDGQNGLIKSSILIDAEPGFQLNKDEVIQVLSFNVTPKKEGNVDFEISTGNEDKSSATMIVESVTSEPIPFTSNKLEINAIK